MKSFFSYFFLTLVTGLLLASCKDNNTTYAEELEAEQDLIADFISRQGIKVVNTLPEEYPWPEKVYYKSPAGLYFRLTEQGDVQSGDTVETGDMVVVRYLQYTLAQNADTISNLYTTDFSYPEKFSFEDYTQACVGWHEAVTYMKRHNSEASVIVYSRIGFKRYNRPATPIGYDLKIQIQKNN